MKGSSLNEERSAFSDAAALTGTVFDHTLYFDDCGGGAAGVNMQTFVSIEMKQESSVSAEDETERVK